MLRFVVLVGEEPDSIARSVVVFRAVDFPDANSRALEIGHSMGESWQQGSSPEAQPPTQSGV
jgi:replication-associated recombination protein RarA